MATRLLERYKSQRVSGKPYEAVQTLFLIIPRYSNAGKDSEAIELLCDESIAFLSDQENECCMELLKKLGNFLHMEKYRKALEEDDKALEHLLLTLETFCANARGRLVEAVNREIKSLIENKILTKKPSVLNRLFLMLGHAAIAAENNPSLAEEMFIHAGPLGYKPYLKLLLSLHEPKSSYQNVVRGCLIYLSLKNIEGARFLMENSEARYTVISGSHSDIRMYEDKNLQFCQFLISSCQCGSLKIFNDTLKTYPDISKQFESLMGHIRHKFFGVPLPGNQSGGMANIIKSFLQPSSKEAPQSEASPELEIEPEDLD